MNQQSTQGGLLPEDLLQYDPGESSFDSSSRSLEFPAIYPSQSSIYPKANKTHSHYINDHRITPDDILQYNPGPPPTIESQVTNDTDNFFKQD